jgi:hypothetical protein
VGGVGWPPAGAGPRAGLAGLRGASLLFGGRGRPGVDVDALVAVAKSIGEVLVERSLELVECNPVLVAERGAIALDASIRLQGRVGEQGSAPVKSGTSPCGALK